MDIADYSLVLCLEIAGAATQEKLSFLSAGLPEGAKYPAAAKAKISMLTCKNELPVSIHGSSGDNGAKKINFF